MVADVTFEVVKATVPPASGNAMARALVAVELKVVAAAPVPRTKPLDAVEAVTTPVTPKVPAIVVLPEEAVTLNLLVLIAKSEVTPNVPVTVELPVIETPPVVTVSPVPAVTVPAKLGLEATFNVTEPPNETDPPVVRLVPAVTVKLELARLALVIPAEPERLELVRPVMVLEPAAIVAPVTVPLVAISIVVESRANVPAPPPMVTAPVDVPVLMLVAKLELTFKLIAAPLAVNPDCAVTKPAKVGLLTILIVALVVPERLMLVPAVSKEATFWNVGAPLPPEVST